MEPLKSGTQHVLRAGSGAPVPVVWLHERVGHSMCCVQVQALLSRLSDYTKERDTACAACRFRRSCPGCLITRKSGIQHVLLAGSGAPVPVVWLHERVGRSIRQTSPENYIRCLRAGHALCDTRLAARGKLFYSCTHVWRQQVLRTGHTAVSVSPVLVWTVV